MLRQLSPGVLEPKDGAASECWHDLEHAIEVLEEAANISDGSPLLELGHALSQVLAVQNLGHNKLWDLVEALAEQEDIPALAILLGAHPGLAKQLLARNGAEDLVVHVRHLLGDLWHRQLAEAGTTRDSWWCKQKLQLGCHVLEGRRQLFDDALGRLLFRLAHVGLAEHCVDEGECLLS